MDSATIIIGFIIIIICILPFLIGKKKTKIETKNKLNKLNEFVKESNGNISNYQSWDNSIIGLDKNSKKLYFIRTIQGTEIKKEIDLNEIKMSIVIISRSSFNSHVEIVQLSFEYLNRSTPNSYLEFFNTQIDGLTITGQLQIAQEWEVKINELILT